MAHPVVGPGLETLLRIERRFEVRRVASLAEAAAVASHWRADVAFVDGLLLQDGDRGDLGIPAYVLSGNEADGRALGAKLDASRGWLRKDATTEELTTAVDRAAPPPLAGGELARNLALTLGLAVTLVLLLWWGWLALARAG